MEQRDALSSRVCQFGPNWVNKLSHVSLSPFIVVIIIAYSACLLVSVLLLHTSKDFIGVIFRGIRNNSINDHVSFFVMSDH
jgi:hypothetical protein